MASGAPTRGGGVPLKSCPVLAAGAQTPGTEADGSQMTLTAFFIQKLRLFFFSPPGFRTRSFVGFMLIHTQSYFVF